MSLWPFQNPNTLDLTVPLRGKYGGWLRDDILSISLQRQNGKCVLEIVNALPSPSDPDERRTTVQTIDLSFISNFAKTSNSIFEDARKLVKEITPNDIIQTVPLFTEAATRTIDLVALSAKRTEGTI